MLVNITLLISRKISLIILCFCIFSYPLNAKNVDSSLATLAQQISQNEGKVIFIDFWASWCIPCRHSFPWMNEMKQKYAADGFEVISINLDRDKQHAIKFLQEVPANFTVIYDSSGSLAKKYKLKGMPSSFILNKQGDLVSSHTGFNQEKSLIWEKEIGILLKNKATE